jgi:hypothetical protein
MTFSSLLNVVLVWPLLASGLLLPGFLLGRSVRSPAPWLSAFLGSAVILFYLVLGLDILHVTLGLTSLAIGLAGANGLLLIVPLKTGRASNHPAGPREDILPRGWNRLWLVPPVLGLTAVAVRAMVEPLSGYDNVFRWDFLARQMIRTGTLAFYPPVSAADFNLYGWCDGIPPLVPILNFWSYLSAGQSAALATTPRVLIEAGLLFHAVWRLARGLGGPAAGWPATAALSVTPLALWGVAMGQETGLTALTLVAMFVFLDEHRRDGGDGSLFWAGLSAGAGALSREYGLVWPLIGLAALAWHGSLRQSWKIFGITAAIIAAPWYLRNWVHTGNPLFSHNLGGVFPTNIVHDELMRTIAGLYRIGANPDYVPFALQALAVTAGLTVALGLWSGLRATRVAVPLLTAAIVVAALCYWSVSQTAGGWVYATRVLTPALALAAVLAGRLLARAGTRTWLVAAAFIPLSADAALRSLYLPGDPLIAPWKLSPTRWHDLGSVIAAKQDSRLWSAVAQAISPFGIIVDDPANHALLAAQGARAVPLTSPEVAIMFETGRPFAETLAGLRAQGLRFVLLAPHSLHLSRFAAKNPFLSELQAHHDPVLNRGDFLLYDLQLITP